MYSYFVISCHDRDCKAYYVTEEGSLGPLIDIGMNREMVCRKAQAMGLRELSVSAGWMAEKLMQKKIDAIAVSQAAFQKAFDATNNDTKSGPIKKKKTLGDVMLSLVVAIILLSVVSCSVWIADSSHAVTPYSSTTVRTRAGDIKTTDYGTGGRLTCSEVDLGDGYILTQTDTRDRSGHVTERTTAKGPCQK